MQEDQLIKEYLEKVQLISRIVIKMLQDKVLRMIMTQDGKVP